jgi:hypothetical protein
MTEEAPDELDFTNPRIDWSRGTVPAQSARPDAAANGAAITTATASNAPGNLSETTIFQPGALRSLADSERAPVRGIAKADSVGVPSRSGPAGPLAPAGPGTASPVAVIEWPWGATVEFRTRMNIGRDQGFCTFAAELASETYISRQHAVLEVCAEGIRVRDLASRNGTFVDGERVPGGQAVLVTGDAQIRFGPVSVVRLTLKR